MAGGSQKIKTKKTKNKKRQNETKTTNKKRKNEKKTTNKKRKNGSLKTQLNKRINYGKKYSFIKCKLKKTIKIN
jgi:hypothetical protein